MYMQGHHAKVSGQYRQCPVVKDCNYWYAGFDGLDYNQFKKTLKDDNDDLKTLLSYNRIGLNNV